MKLQKIFKRKLNPNVRYKEEKINYTELKNLLRKEDVILIDVRSPQEYQEGHLNHAINIPFYEFANDINKRVKNKDNCIVVYCQSGIRSSKVMKELKKLEYNNIYELEGGLDQIY